MLFLKQIADNMRLLLPTMQMASQAYAKRRRRSGLRHSPAHRFDHELSQVGLRRDTQLPGISLCLQDRITHHALFGAHVSMSRRAVLLQSPVRAIARLLARAFPAEASN